jgi:hypothetical protein
VLPRYYIFAANARHADHYAKELGLGGINQPNVRYIYSPEQLWGVYKYPNDEFLFYETFWEHPKAHEIYEQFEIIERTGVRAPYLREELPMEENKDTFWWKLIHLDPVLLRGAIMASVALLASFGLIVAPGVPDALVGFIGVIFLAGQALWTRSSVTPNAKVAVSVPDPVNALHVVEAGEARTTASNTEILEAAKN